MVYGAINDGAVAVNRFYEYCGIEDRLRPQSHVNFSELDAGESGRFNLGGQETELRKRFEAALGARQLGEHQ